MSNGVQTAKSVCALAELLPTIGTAVLHADLIALGLLTRWHEYCWSNLTDTFASEQEAELASGWTGTVGRLVPLAEQAGVLVAVHQYLCCPTALGAAPQHIRQVWRRHKPQGLREAVQRQRLALARPVRASLAAKVVDAVTDDEIIPQPLNLFGESDEQKPPPKRRPKGAAGQDSFIKHFCTIYRNKYGRPYIFRGGRDGKTVSTLIAAVGVTRLKAAAAAYLRDNSPFYAGHDLGRFAADINRFLIERPGETQRSIPRIQ